jgi:hypothetical protein
MGGGGGRGPGHISTDIIDTEVNKETKPLRRRGMSGASDWSPGGDGMAVFRDTSGVVDFMSPQWAWKYVL